VRSHCIPGFLGLCRLRSSFGDSGDCRGQLLPTRAGYEQHFTVFQAWLRRFEDPEAQAFLREQDEQERREQALFSGHPMILRSQEALSEMQRHSVSPDVQEGSSPVWRLATFALEQEAELAVTKQQLHKALAAQKHTPTSRKVLSRARQTTRRDLLNARYAREYAESGGHGRKGKGKGKAKQTKAAKGKGTKCATDEDTVRLDDSEVERQVEELMRLDEEEDAGGPRRQPLYAKRSALG
jgi:hypothetical protein